MTPSETTIVQTLIALSLADGKLDKLEESIIDGLLWAFDATEAEDKALREFAATKPTLASLPLEELSTDDATRLVANAALLTHADGSQTAEEKALLEELLGRVKLSAEQAAAAVADARTRAEKLAKGLEKRR